MDLLVVLLPGIDPGFLHYQCSVMPLYYKSDLERDTGIEPVTKPWQGFEIPLHQSRGILVPHDRIELPSSDYKTDVLPFN